MYESARDVYEEGLTTVTTVRCVLHMEFCCACLLNVWHGWLVDTADTDCCFVWHRDFSLIFDTLTQFEETLLQHKIEHGGADEDEPEQANGTDHDDGEDFLLKDDENDIDLRCAYA